MDTILLVLLVLVLAVQLASFFKKKDDTQWQAQLDKVRQDLLDEVRQTRQELANTVQAGTQGSLTQTENKLESIRNTMETRLDAMQSMTNRRLAEMQHTVDEKLQTTLEDKLQKSFSLVSQQLRTVHEGLGEMRSLATGVGDLKKVLSNVKTRGILGEVQLGAILQQILTKDQYAENVETVPGTRARVEFALRLPGDEKGEVYLPIDAKFPMDAYEALLQAYDTASKEEVDAAAKGLERRVLLFAKEIHTKYIAPPHTTDFGILFVPVEGMYAELVQRGVSETMQREHKIVLAGPTTMAALLNSLQMGFKTLAIQKRSGEVWRVLGDVKTEFETFGKALEQAQRYIDQANKGLETLVGTRTRAMQRKLSSVSTMGESVQEQKLLEQETQ